MTIHIFSTRLVVPPSFVVSVALPYTYLLQAVKKKKQQYWISFAAQDSEIDLRDLAYLKIYSLK